MLETSLEQIGNTAIINLDARDLYDKALIAEISESLSAQEVGYAVINLEQISALSSAEWLDVMRLTDALKLIGIRSAICGVQPALAMTLVELCEGLHISAYMDVDGALNAINVD